MTWNKSDSAGPGPIVAVTMGDPAGIGPEITLKALSGGGLSGLCRPVVIGSCAVLRRAMDIPGMPRPQLRPITSVSQALFTEGALNVLEPATADLGGLTVGTVSAAAGDAAFQYVREAIRLAMAGQVDATVTNPINKEALNRAGHPYSGHTEIYAQLTGTRRYTMMLVYDELRVVHVSTHISLREACDRVKAARVLEVIGIADRACRDMGILRPRVGVAGLNPHCGEGGLFGTEDDEEIRPAVEQARAKGLGAEGPLPADTIFSKMAGGLFDIVVAMYHDQGHIPTKLVGFKYDGRTDTWGQMAGVNITLGLPIIRVSVDHGTAFDRAGKGTANPQSLIEAVGYAARFAEGNRKG